MEMNTRLQVEHPVTEMITGQDLVEWQLRVAAGERCRWRRSNWPSTAIRWKRASTPRTQTSSSCRPRARCASCTPPAVQFMRGGDANAPAAVRIDAGVREGDTISPYYDPMIAKLIVWGRDRDQALARMAQALAGITWWGCRPTSPSCSGW
jgi:3-methylcrotonyl-CoA carboxylase alpha subunit